MNKKGIVAIIIVFLLILILGICFFVKGEWNEAMSTYGPLNIMECDDTKNIKDNYSAASCLLSGKKDFYLSENIRVNKGSVSCIITCNGVKICENVFREGAHQINTDIINDKSGEIIIEIIASDDVDGDYNVAIYTRERILNCFIRRLKENFYE